MYYGLAHCTVCSILVLHFVYGKLQEDNLRYIRSPPDKKYEVILQAVGEPEWPFGSASGRLVLKEGEDKISQTDFELHNDGASISSSCWKVTWHEGLCRNNSIRLKSNLMNKSFYISMVMKEIQQLTDVADIEVEYPSGERLDESRVITEQSFDVELND